MSNKPKFDPSLPFEEVTEKPKFDPTQAFEAVDEEPRQTISVPDAVDDDLVTDPEALNAGHNPDAPSGRKIDPAFVQALSERTGVDKEKLQSQMHRYGATYPDEALEKEGVSPGMSKFTAGAYNALDGILFDAPSWIAKKVQDEPTEKAFDELKAQIDSQKTLGEKTTDFTTSMLSPVGWMGKVKTYADTAKMGGKMGGLFGVTNSRSGDELESGLDGAAMGAILAPGLRKGTELTARGVSKALGRGGDVAKPYMADPARYDGDGIVEKSKNWMREKMGQPTKELREAPKFEKVQESVDDPLKDFLSRVGQNKEELVSAKSAAQRASKEYKQSLKDSRFDEDLPEALKTSLKGQRDVVKDLSGKQRAALQEQAKNKVPIDDLIAQVDAKIESRKVEGVLLPGDKEVAQLNKYKRLLTALKKKDEVAPSGIVNERGQPIASKRPDVGPSEVKPESLLDIRQRIDDELSDLYNSPTGSHSTAAERALLQQRAAINEKLDAVGGQGYNKLRGRLSEEVGLAEAASKTFGGDRSTSALAGLKNPNNAEKLEILKRLDKRSGGTLLPKIQKYLSDKKLEANTPARDNIIAKLPESQRAQQLASEAAELRASHKRIGDLTPDKSQEAIRRVMHAGPKKPETRTIEAFDELGKQSNQDLLTKIQDLKVAQAFAGGSPQGSRLVNTGRAFGKNFGPIGEAVGAGAGLVADYSTGKVAKLALKSHLWSQKPGTKLVGVTAGKVVAQLEGAGEAGEHYSAVLDKAAEKSPDAFMATHQTLLKDPAYRAIVEGDEG